MTHDDRPDPAGPTGGEPPELSDPGDPFVVAAIARTRADLAAHATRTPPMPADLIADLDRALDAERATPSAGGHGVAGGIGVTGGGGVAEPTRADRRHWWPLAVAAAVLAMVVAVGAALLVPGTGPGPGPAPVPTAAPPSPTAPVPELAPGDGPSALRAGLGRADYGPLADPARLAECLAAHGVAPGTVPLGARQVVVGGTPGVLLVLPTGVAARFRLLVVEPGCSAQAPLTVSDTVVGR